MHGSMTFKKVSNISQNFWKYHTMQTGVYPGFRLIDFRVESLKKLDQALPGLLVVGFHAAYLITQPTTKGKWLSCFIRFQYSYQPEIALRTSVRISWYLWFLQSLGHWGQMKTNRKLNFVIDDGRRWSEYIHKIWKNTISGTWNRNGKNIKFKKLVFNGCPKGLAIWWHVMFRLEFLPCPWPLWQIPLIATLSSGASWRQRWNVRELVCDSPF